MAKFLNETLKNLTEYPNSFKRQGAFPLEAYSVFNTLSAAEDYASNSPIAYVGQPLAVTTREVKIEGEGEETTEIIIETATFYVIGNTDGALIELGTSADIDGLNARLMAVEKFFEATEELDQTIDTLYELQEYIKEHGEDFGELHKDVKDIYTPYEPADMEKGTPEVPESGYLVDKEKQLRSEIQGIYKQDAEGKETGKLPEEVERLDARIDDIYDEDGGLADDGVTKIPSGRLVKEKERAEKAEQDILDSLLGTNANKEGGEFYEVSDGILAGIRGQKTENGYEYNNIVEYIQGSIPVATENQLGRVLSSKDKDAISVDNQGIMTVNSLNINKLYQTDYLIIDGGTATKVTFQQEQLEPTLEEV